VRIVNLYNQKGNVTAAGLSSIFLYNLKDLLFPLNYQQDDAAELEPTYLDNFLCAFDWGDQHPLFSGIIWTISRIFDNPEYIVSILILLFGILTIFIYFNTLSNLFNYPFAVLGTAFLITSPIFNTYSVALKQYNSEILTSVICLYFLQKNSKSLLAKKDYMVLAVLSLFLFLLSFVNILMLFLLFIYLINKITLKQTTYFAAFFASVVIFQRELISKIQRVSNGGYWDSFFLNTTSSSEFFDSFYFLSQLFFKSLFPIVLHPLSVFLLFISIVFIFIRNDLIVLYSFSAVSLLYVLSALKLYPLGGGRTDLLFLPFLIIIILNFFMYISENFSVLKSSNSFFILALAYLLITLFSAQPYYKNETINPLLIEIENIYNSEEVALLVTEEQSHSFLYYSKKLYGFSYTSTQTCSFESNINNLFIQKNDEKIELIKEVQNFQKIILIGIELPNTNGQLRIVSNQLIDNGYLSNEEKTYPGYLKLLYFTKG
jgi:hypothetical protein